MQPATRQRWPVLFWEGKKGSENVHPEDLGFAKLFEVINRVIAADAKTQRIVLWNSGATGIFGYSPSEALNEMGIEGLVPERFEALHQAGMAHYHETGSKGLYVDTNRLLGLAAVAKTGKKIRVEVYLSTVTPEHDRGGPYVWPSGTTSRSETEPRSSPRSCFVTSPSGEPMYEPYITHLPNVVSEPRVPLQEAKRWSFQPPSERHCACSLWGNYRLLREHRR